MILGEATGRHFLVTVFPFHWPQQHFVDLTNTYSEWAWKRGVWAL